MIHIGIVSYSVCAFFYLIFLAVLLTDKHRGRVKNLLLIAVLSSVVWAGALASAPTFHNSFLFINAVEFAKSALWIAFIVGMLASASIENINLSTRNSRLIKYFVLFLVLFITLVVLIYKWSNYEIVPGLSISMHLMMAVVGIVLLEQFFRNVPQPQRWVIKFLCLGLLGSFLYNFYMYSDAMLYQRIDPVLWQTRGFVEALLLPLIAYSVSRDPLWSPEIFISRRVVFHSAALLTSAVYLFVMGIAGYYVKEFGGSWGAVVQAFLLFATILFLSVILASRRIRAKLKVFVNKNFYPYKYDYREEWLRLIRVISLGKDNLYHESIRVIAQIIESPSGLLWLDTGDGYFECVEGLHKSIVNDKQPSHSSLPAFLGDNEFVINVDEYWEKPEAYSRLGKLELPEWVSRTNTWLIVPLIHIDQLIGFIALEPFSEGNKDFNWEDSDLLKTSARQVASYISQMKTSVALAEAKQFESFNKLSTYIVHDMKNLVSQLSLIVKNAEKHKNNPMFMEDALNTVDNTVKKMNKMLDAVKNKSTTTDSKQFGTVNIIEILEELIHAKKTTNLYPVPVLGCESRKVFVRADRDQLMSIFGHIIQNAQDATPEDGEVLVQQLLDNSGNVIIRFADTGCGMSEKFIKDHLFTPFRSTKGKGMGIGVYETKEIITALGGSIYVQSQLRNGTVFTVSLPLVA